MSSSIASSSKLQVSDSSTQQSQTPSLTAPLLPPPTLLEILSSFSSHGSGDRALLVSILAAKRSEDDRLANEWKYRKHMLAAWTQANGLLQPVPGAGEVKKEAGGRTMLSSTRGGQEPTPLPSSSSLSPPLPSINTSSKPAGKRWSASSSTSPPPLKRSRTSSSPPVNSNSTLSPSETVETTHERKMAIVRARLLEARQRQRQRSNSSTSSEGDDGESVGSMPRTPEASLRQRSLGELLCDGRAGGLDGVKGTALGGAGVVVRVVGE